MAQGQKLVDQHVIDLEKEILSKFDDVKTMVHGLQGEIDALEGNWQGIGANAFNQKQYEINTSLARMGNILSTFLDALNKTRGIKDATEDQIRSSAQKIDVYDGAPKSTIASF
ncbi:WXG100 family type VII secretion target [Streptomyces sp. NPDC002004]